VARTTLGDIGPVVLMFDIVFTSMIALYDSSQGNTQIQALMNNVLLQNAPTAQSVNCSGLTPLDTFYNCAVSLIRLAFAIIPFLVVAIASFFLLMVIVVPLTGLPGIPGAVIFMGGMQVLLFLWLLNMVLGHAESVMGSHPPVAGDWGA